MKLQHIDSAQYIIEANLYKTRRYEEGYDADGRFIEPFYKEHADKFCFVDEVLCYYNHLTFSRKANLPRILYIGPGLPELRSKQLYNFEEDKLDVFYTTNDNDIESILINYNPNAIVTVGESDKNFPNLYKQPVEVRKKWIHVKDVDLDLGTKAYYCAMIQILENNIVLDERVQVNPLKLRSWFGDSILDHLSQISNLFVTKGYFGSLKPGVLLSLLFFY